MTSKSEKLKRKSQDSANENTTTPPLQNGTSEKPETFQSENKKQKMFSARTFRRSLTTPEGLENVKEFVTLCTEDKREDYAMQYLDVGGNCLELVHMLETSEKKKVSQATPILQAINIVILKVIAALPQNIPQSEDACRNLLNNYSTTIHAVLSSDASPKQRRVVLQLLTAIVTLSPLLAKEILNNIEINDATLNILTEPSIGDQSLSVRTCFIHFLLSFIIDGNITNIKMLLERKGFISSIFNDLIYDDASTVHLVLTTLKNHILENSNIIKTTKLYTFNTGVVKNLVNLYNWKGYKYWRLKIRIKSSYSSENLINQEEKSLVVTTVHDFLLLLCTSHKYGVIFNDKTLGFSGKNHNPLIQTVLESLQCPWEHKYASELVVQIVKSCPDLFKFVITSVSDYLEPRNSPKWFNLVGFLKKIFSVIKVKNLIEYIKDLPIGQLLAICTNFCTPEIILKAFKDDKFINNSDLKVCEINIDLFDHILINLLQFFEDLKSYNILNNEEIKNLKHLVSQSIIKNLPSIKIILKSWNSKRELETNDDDSSGLNEIFEIKNYKISIINILNSYGKLFPLSLQEIEAEFTPGQLLKDVEECGINIKHGVLLNAVDLFLTWDINAFLPSHQYFSSYLCLLLSKIDRKTIQVISKIFISTKIFHNNELEVEIWLDPLNYFESPIINQMLIESITKAYNGLSNTVENEGIPEEKLYDLNQEIDDIFDNLEFGNLSSSNEHPKHKKISSLLFHVSDFLKSYQNSDLENMKICYNYYMFSLLNLFHAQTIPFFVFKALNFDLLKKIGKKLKYFKDLLNYLNSWNTSELVALEESIPELMIVNNLNRALLSEEALEISSTFNLTKSTTKIDGTVEILGENYQIENELQKQINLNLVKMTIFCFTQQLTKHLIEPIKIENSLNSLIVLHKILTQQNVQNHEKILEIIYKNPIIYQNFVPLSSSKEKIHKFTTEFVLKATKYFKSISDNCNFLNPYREKLVTRIIITLAKYHKNLSSNRSELLISLFETFDLNYENCVQIIEKISKIPSEAFITKENQLSIFVNLLSKTLVRISNIYKVTTTEMLSIEIVSELIQHFHNLLSNQINIDNFIEALHKFFEKFPHFISTIDSKIIPTLINRSELTKTEIRFLTFLLEKNEKLIKPINKNIDQVIDKKDLIFALFKILVKNKKFLNLNKTDEIFVKYAHVIQKIVEKPQKIGVNIREYYTGVVHLIEMAMPVNLCVKIAQKIQKPEVVELFHLDVLEAIVLKATTEENSAILLNYLQTLIHLLIVSLKRNEPTKVAVVCPKIESFINKIETDLKFDPIRKTNNWITLIRLLLKHGIKNTEENHLLHTLVILCDKIYSKTESKNEEILNEIATIHDMILSHSEFLGLILSNSRNKTELLKLLLILSTNNESVMIPKLIPVFLGAYNATLNLSDRLILALLARYESANIDFHNYRPYLWGETAINHYSVRNNIETALWKQSNASQVFSLLSPSNIANTITNYDLKRTLIVDEAQIEKLLQTNDEMEIVKRSPDKLVRIKQSSSARKMGKFSPSVDGVYDPCFYLPLFSHLLAFESTVPYYKFSESGGLALTLLALASECQLMRQAAYNVLARFHYHVEAKSDSRNKDLWLEFINTIRRALAHICTDSKIEDVRIPYIYAVFLARSSIIMTDPLNRMFMTINNFLFVKEVHDFRSIPEFLHLLHSPDVDYRVHRIWLLQVIRDGFRTELDFDSAHRTMAFKILMDFYSSILADLETKSLLLQIIAQAVNLPKAYRFLMSSCLLSWLSIIADGLKQHEICLVEPLIEILSVLWSAEGVQLSRSNELRSSCWLKLLLKISRILSANVKLDYFAKFMKILTQVYQAKMSGLERGDLERIVDLSEAVIGESDCKYVIHFGCKYVERPKDFDVNDRKILAVNYMRLLTILWIENNRVE